MIAAFEAAHRQAVRLRLRRQGRSSSRASRSRRSAAAPTIDEPDEPLDRARPAAGRDATRFYSDGAWHDAGVHLRDALAPGPARRRARRSIIEPHQTIVVEPGWQAEVTARDHIVLTRAAPLPKRARARHRGRPGDARGVQQPLHVDRRADGRDAAEHRLFGQHQGAARLLLRGLRRRRARSSPTRRTCRCISARWTARSRRSSG